MLKQKLKRLFYITVVGFVFFCILYLILKILTLFLPSEIQGFYNQISLKDLSKNADALKEAIISYNPYSQLIFIVFQIVQVVLAPIPGQVTGVLGGYIFGFSNGLIYTMIGLLIGSFIVIKLGRAFGYSLLRKFLSIKVLEKYEYLRSEESLSTFFIIFLLPYFPDDAICFIAGMTRIKIWKLMLVCFLGRLPGMAVFSYMGSAIEENSTLSILIFAIAVILSTIYWLFDQDIKKLFRLK